MSAHNGAKEWSSVLSYLAYGFAVALVLLYLFVRYIPNNRIGVVEKLASRHGSVTSGFIALHGEAGFQPQVLRGGWHVLPRLVHRVHVLPLVTIPQGRIGYVFARDGQPLSPTQTLGGNVSAADFQDTAAFLAKGGQRGPQRQILREGTYAINLAQFIVLTDATLYHLVLDHGEGETVKRMAQLISERQGFTPVVLKGTDDLLGVVTVHEGPSLPEGQIIAPTVGDDPAHTPTYHNNFQEPERFLRAGGLRGRQLQVLLEGTYYINRLFATVETVPKTVVEVGHVGVVVSYVGKTGADLSGTDYKHGELVSSGRRGVWSEALLPGKYAFNTSAGKVVMVPTTNFILKWIRSEHGPHHFDENLSEVALITKDAFEPSLPLSVVLHIDYRKAPLVTQRFGDIKKLVEQTLDPMVSAYFKNIAQTRTLIQLLQDRAAIQELAGQQMKEKFAHYNLELEEVLIGTPTSITNSGSRIEEILSQLRARQIAEEQVETYARQERAAVKQRELKEAEARAQQQQALTESEIAITVQGNQGKAEYQRSLQEAARIRALADADAERITRVGIAQAIAAEEQVRAYGGPQYQVTQQVMSRFAEAVEKSGIELVPRVLVSNDGNGNGSHGGNAFEALLTVLLSEKLAGSATEASPADAAVTALKSSLRESALTRPAGV